MLQYCDESAHLSIFAKTFTLKSLAMIAIIIKVHSYIALRLVHGTVQSTLHFTPGRPLHSSALSTSLGSIEPHCNYCTKIICSYIHLRL